MLFEKRKRAHQSTPARVSGTIFAKFLSKQMQDHTKKRGRFILTGSHQPQLHEAISQSLAGRTAILNLWPFSLHEVRRYRPAGDPFELICRGCYPRVHEEDLEPRRFFNSYLQTYIERDVRALIAENQAVGHGRGPL